MRKDHAHSISGPATGRDMRFSPKHVPYAHYIARFMKKPDLKRIYL